MGPLQKMGTSCFTHIDYNCKCLNLVQSLNLVFDPPFLKMNEYNKDIIDATTQCGSSYTKTTLGSVQVYIFKATFTS
jgi:hypothetical protein